MSGKGLPIIEESIRSKKEQFEEKTRLYCERVWLEEETPHVLKQERIKRTETLLAKLDLKGKSIADLGCGTAPFATALKEAQVTGVDILQTALEQAPPSIKKVCACLPYCRLPEESFDGVLLADVIAELEPHLYRLMLSEAASLLNRNSFFLCSTELDVHSEDPLGHFLDLIKTEFDVLETTKSSHRLYLFLRKWLDAPTTFVRASKEKSYRLHQLEERNGLYRLWFYLNSLKWVANLWRPLTPLKKCFKKRPLILLLERLSEILWGDGAITHVIVLCKKKSLHPLNK